LNLIQAEKDDTVVLRFASQEINSIVIKVLTNDIDVKVDKTTYRINKKTNREKGKLNLFSPIAIKLIKGKKT
jgi:3'-phosphoadenosine 5'-phosphosulfate sulfotransferase (PAPS reductase)/FAD synthetase